jgi:hypothetical protein
MINSWKTETHRPATINPSFKQNFGWLNWWNHVKSCEKSFVVRVQQPMVSCFFFGGVTFPVPWKNILHILPSWC